MSDTVTISRELLEFLRACTLAWASEYEFRHGMKGFDWRHKKALGEADAALSSPAAKLVGVPVELLERIDESAICDGTDAIINDDLFIQLVSSLTPSHSEHNLDMVREMAEGKIVTIYDVDSRSYEEHPSQRLDTKGSRKALGAMNAKLRRKVGHLERQLAEYQRAQQTEQSRAGEREAFEDAYINVRGCLSAGVLVDLRRGEDYADSDGERLNIAWRVWQARAALSGASKGWRDHSVQFAKGRKCPATIETLQAAWDRDQELINDMRHEIARHKTRINRLEQRRTAKPDAELVELKALLPALDEALEDLEIHGRHSDQGYRKLKDWYRKVALITGRIDAKLAELQSCSPAE